MQTASVRLVVPPTLWQACLGSSCSSNDFSANFTLRLTVYGNAKLFPVGQPDRDVITDVITTAVGL